MIITATVHIPSQNISSGLLQAILCIGMLKGRMITMFCLDIVDLTNSVMSPMLHV